MKTPRQNRQNETMYWDRNVETLNTFCGIGDCGSVDESPQKKPTETLRINRSDEGNCPGELLEAAIRFRRSAHCVLTPMTHCITSSLFSDWISPFAPAVQGVHGNLGSFCQLVALHWFLSTTQFAKPVTGGGQGTLESPISPALVSHYLDAGKFRHDWLIELFQGALTVHTTTLICVLLTTSLTPTCRPYDHEIRLSIDTPFFQLIFR
jgi:hypothetical protein